MSSATRYSVHPFAFVSAMTLRCSPRTREVALPVVVRGPTDADTLIVFQHGGPGGADLDAVAAFEHNLQQHFLYASWAHARPGIRQDR